MHEMTRLQGVGFRGVTRGEEARRAMLPNRFYGKKTGFVGT